MPPNLVLFAGDPSGVGPEIVAKVIAAPESLPPAQVKLIAQRASIEAGAQAAGIDIDLDSIGFRERAPIDIVPWDGWDMPLLPLHESAAGRGGLLLAGLRLGLDFARQKLIDAVCFAPVDRAALRAAGMLEEDELHWAAQVLDYHGPCHEIRVLDNVWTVLLGTSPDGQPIAITSEDVAGAIAVLAGVLWKAGKLGGRIAVCAPRPHSENAQDAERTAVLEAGVRLAIARGHTAAEGPLPADQVFARAKSGGLDGVITTHPDQEPINATLMGFERGATIFGGLPAAVTTPAHGTARDIAGRGIANPWALRNAMALALRIASG